MDTRRKHQLFDRLRRIEDGLINVVLRAQSNRELKRGMLRDTDAITDEYKKEIQAYWKPYTRRVNTDRRMKST